MSNFDLYLMAGLYIVAGILHFVSPRTYLAIIPPYIPYPKILVDLSGFFEILFGLGLLFTQTRTLSAWGLILLLIAVFPANVYMATSGKFRKIPSWLLWARLPLQGLLIWWAYSFT